MKKPILDIDAKGFARIQGDKPKGRMLLELIQNAKDEDGVTEIEVKIDMEPGRPLAAFRIKDNSPVGFQDLSHAYTLFAPSYKLSNPEKSGWMNLGEKMVIVGCKDLTIHTTKGLVYFDMEDQTREEHPKQKRECGTEISGTMKMTREEFPEVVYMLKSFIPPEHIKYTVNYALQPERKPLKVFKAALETRILNDSNELTKSVRQTEVAVYEPMEWEEPSIYELGIPVCPNGSKWHFDVKQKVPLGKDRDSVPKAYLEKLYTLVLNEMLDYVTPDETSENWVRQAASNPDCKPEVITKIMTSRFGDKYVIADPSDHEAENEAKGKGYAVVYPRSLTPGERINAAAAGLLTPAGQLFPTPKPFSDDPNAPSAELIDETDYTPGMKNITGYTKWLANELIGHPVHVNIVKKMNAGACYGGRELTFCLQSLGHAFFNNGVTERVDDLILHELGHEYEKNHLSDNYHKALTRLGAKLKKLALDKPEEFRKWK